MAFVPFQNPTYDIDGVWVGNAIDTETQCKWSVGKQSILDGPTMKTRIVERSSRAGGLRRKSYQSTEYRWMAGLCEAPTRIAREQAEAQLRELLSDGDQHTLTVTSPWRQRKTKVEQHGGLKIEQLPSGGAFTWQVNLAATDPRWLSPVGGYSKPLLPPIEGTGLDWTGGGLGGLDWTGGGLGGLDWGTPSSNGTLVLTNNGGATEWPVVRLIGPLAAGASVRLAETGDTYTYGPALGSGDFLDIDSFPDTRAVTLNGIADRMSSMIAAQWFEIPRRSSVTLVLAASGAGSMAATWFDADVM
jgi:hypothetical protein